MAKLRFREPYRLLSGVEYVVGRRNCTILLQDDQSISRSHAVLTVSRPETSPSQCLSVPILTVRDTSKYGTFVNGSKLNGASVSLQSGDRINFGVFESKFRVEYEPLVVCSSCLDVAQKNALNQAIQQLGGLVVNEWTKECTHLVMVSVKVTVKTICALICARPIIKPEFFSELIRAIQSRQQLPNHESFYPPVDEPSIGSENLDLSEHQERKKIFSGKTFVFLSAKQHKKLGPAVVLGGGEVKLMTEGRKEMPLLLSPEVCVVDVGLANSQLSGSDSVTNWTDSILTDLESKNLRAIPEAEIGLAVIFMSTEKYCNPQKQPASKAVAASSASAVVGRAISQSPAVDEAIMPTAADSSTLYIPDTEEQTCMEIENTSQVHRQRKMAFQDTAGKKNSGTSGSVNAGPSIPRGNRTSGFSQRSQPVSPSKIPEAGKPCESASRHQSNSIMNYFQVSRKRERAEEEETSVPKIAKLEERSSPLPKCTDSTTSLICNSEAKQHQKKNNILEPNPNFAEDMGIKSMRESVKLTSDRTDTKTTSSENHAPKKRKELDDLSKDTEALEIVFGSGDIDWEDQMVDHDQEAQRSKRKKQCLEAKGSRIPEVNVNQQEENKVLKEEDLGSVLTSEMKSNIKQESPVLNHSKLQDDSSNLPSRLLLTEFRSLVVSHPRQNSHLSGNTSYGGKKNFKMFKKVAYPGAGQLPHIIGGSDLIAHHAKKNSELEDWLRQEIEEQNRHAREESLADDLFRYDPNVKRRR
ncbi:nibrin isoform X4 [Onychostruthus taczanowskii]|uniref:nibrin isoform X4 n=1 Tax=Onychostruthus taczanowskii TaxID=356909 RepID=UPI001B800428|nr:nibrin isoform X4 [Onychostruthus taczanowskii]XP_041268876.1 nibrin isoform X4 [Onychostruthus taczanowskii]